MKISDVAKITALAKKLEVIDKLELWLKSWPEVGLSLDANGLLGTVQISNFDSSTLLASERSAVLRRLSELGVSELA